MHGLIGKITATPGDGARLRDILLGGTTGMPGCLSYGIATDADDPDVLWITEVWTSAEAHQASLQLPAVQAAIGEGRALIAGMERVCTTTPASPSYKPPGHSTVSAYLSVTDAAATLAFVEAGLGGQIGLCVRRDDGSLMHAEVRVEDSVIMVGQPEGASDLPGSDVHIYVPDVDACFDRLLASGGTELQAPKQNPGESDRRAGVVGPSGTRFWVATKLDG